MTPGTARSERRHNKRRTTAFVDGRVLAARARSDAVPPFVVPKRKPKVKTVPVEDGWEGGSPASEARQPAHDGATLWPQRAWADNFAVWRCWCLCRADTGGETHAVGASCCRCFASVIWGRRWTRR